MKHGDFDFSDKTSAIRNLSNPLVGSFPENDSIRIRISTVRFPQEDCARTQCKFAHRGTKEGHPIRPSPSNLLHHQCNELMLTTLVTVQATFVVKYLRYRSNHNKPVLL